MSGNVYIMMPPKNITAREGTKVRLGCLAEGYPNNITYHWYRDGRNLLQVSNLLTRLTIEPDGSLIIIDVHRTDSNWYTCRPSNGFGTAPEVSAFINITRKLHYLSRYNYSLLTILSQITCYPIAVPSVTNIVLTNRQVAITVYVINLFLTR